MTLLPMRKIIVLSLCFSLLLNEALFAMPQEIIRMPTAESFRFDQQALELPLATSLRPGMHF